MSFASPTPIRLGMSANFRGKIWQVVGRAVFQVSDTGTDYYWQEYYLETAGGEEATLVFEETGDGAEWRFFTMFEPEASLVANRDSTGVGDLLDVNNTTFRVTWVGISRVCFVEGKTPATVQLLIRDNYFNANKDNQMVVVSWNNDVVECYDGLTISVGEVASAFQMAVGARLIFCLSGGRSVANPKVWQPSAVVLVLILSIFWSIWQCTRSPSTQYKLTVLKAPLPTLKVGSSGSIQGANYQIVGRALVEIAETGIRARRQEYNLHDDGGDDFLLTCEEQSGKNRWTFFRPFRLEDSLRPEKAAAIPRGKEQIGGRTAVVTQLFRLIVLHTEQTVPQDMLGGDVFYGFSGSIGTNLLLVRWNQTNITSYEGRGVQPSDLNFP